VEGHHGHLHAEAEEEGDEERDLQPHRQEEWVRLGRLEVRYHVERPCAIDREVEIEGEDSEKHYHAAHVRVYEELDGRIVAVWSSPYGDEEVHGYEDQLPEDEEQEEVQRDEDASYRQPDEEDETEELVRALLLLPRVYQPHQHEKLREENERGGQPVHAHDVVETEARGPRVHLEREEPASGVGSECDEAVGQELENEDGRENETYEGEDHGDPFRVAPSACDC